MTKTYHKALQCFSGRPKTRILGWGEQNKKYPLMVANANPPRKPSIHWWSLLDTDEIDTLFILFHLVR